MPDETIYNPGSMSEVHDYEDVLSVMGEKFFPELRTSGHMDFNDYLAQHPELQGMTEDYNVLGGMDVAKRIPAGSTWWSGKMLPVMGGIYSLADTLKSPHQDWKEGFGDWYRNVKGIGIKRNWNPFGLLYDPKEKDYYKGLYEKMNRSERVNELPERVNELPERVNVPSSVPVPAHISGGNGGVNRSGPSRDRGRSRGRGETGQIAGGHHFSRGGLMDIPLSGRSRDI